MRKSTGILLIITLILNIWTIVLSLVVLKKDLIYKRLLYADIVVDIIMSIYILYLFCYIKAILYIAIVIKMLAVALNIANIAVVIYLVYSAKEKGRILTGKNIRLYLLYELIFLLKLYIYIHSFLRNKEAVDSSSRDGCCFVSVPNEQEDENSGENSINSRNQELNELKKEYLTLREENLRLKDDKTNIDKNIFRKKKIEIICQYVKEKYNINISNDTLLKKFFLVIKNKCNGFMINKEKYEEIILDYIKKRIFSYLFCPITGQMFSNPYITPDGQTFDRLAIINQIKKNGVNPITKNILSQDDLIENKLVLDICEIVKLNDEYFNIQHFQEIKKLLKSQITKEYYNFPYVISQGSEKGYTKEKYRFSKEEKYPNLIIMNMIKQNTGILDDNFLKFDFEIDYEDNLKIEPNMIKEEEEPKVIRAEEESINKINKEILYKPRRTLPEE